MNSFKRSSLLAGAFLALALPFQAEAADYKNINVVGVTPERIVVKNEGGAYTKLKTFGQMKYTVNIYYDTGAAGRIKGWRMTPKALEVGGYRQAPGVPAHAISKTYPAFSRPKELDNIFSVSFPVQELESLARLMCKDNAEDLRKSGKSEAYILGKSHNLAIYPSVDVEVDATGPKGNNKLPPVVYEQKLIEVVCEAMPINAGTMAMATMVTSASLALKEITSQLGACAVRATTTLKSNKPDAQIKYRYVHSSGKKSNVFSTETGKHKTAVVTHDWDVPNKPGNDVGWLRIEGVSPKFKSNIRSYNMDCKTAVPGGFATTGPEPTRQKPDVIYGLGGAVQPKN